MTSLREKRVVRAGDMFTARKSRYTVDRQGEPPIERQFDPTRGMSSGERVVSAALGLRREADAADKGRVQGGGLSFPESIVAEI